MAVELESALSKQKTEGSHFSKSFLRGNSFPRGHRSHSKTTCPRRCSRHDNAKRRARKSVRLDGRGAGNEDQNHGDDSDDRGSARFRGGGAISAQDKYALKVPNGLSFSEFKGYEAWQVVSISQDGNLIAAILANPVMIKAYLDGVPGNGKPFPDGAKMAKIHWNPKKMETFPAATVPVPSMTSTSW